MNAEKENSARLGKGLSAIFGEDVGNVLEDIQQGKTEVHEDSKFEVEVKDVKPNPYQPRKTLMMTRFRSWLIPLSCMVFLHQFWLRKPLRAMN